MYLYFSYCEGWTFCQRWRRLKFTFSITITTSVSQVWEKNETHISKRFLIYGKEKCTPNKMKKLYIRNEKIGKKNYLSFSFIDVNNLPYCDLGRNIFYSSFIVTVWLQHYFETVNSLGSLEYFKHKHNTLFKS